jgi:hypothetical protein
MLAMVCALTFHSAGGEAADEIFAGDDINDERR